jgi:hypothetical protein
MTTVLRHIFFGDYTFKDVADAIKMTAFGNLAGALWIGIPAALVNYMRGERDPHSIMRSFAIGALTCGAFRPVFEQAPAALVLRIITVQGLAVAILFG